MSAVLEHRKAAAAEGRKVLLTNAFTALGMAVFQWILFPAMWDEEWFFVVAFLAVEGVIVSLLIYYAVLHLRSDGTFVCRIDDDLITCATPIIGCGETFSISLGSITRIERVNDGETSYRWFIYDHTGDRFWLTSNYDNPDDKFIQAIRERCPGVIDTD